MMRTPPGIASSSMGSNRVAQPTGPPLQALHQGMVRRWSEVLCHLSLSRFDQITGELVGRVHSVKGADDVINYLVGTQRLTILSLWGPSVGPFVDLFKQLACLHKPPFNSPLVRLCLLHNIELAVRQIDCSSPDDSSATAPIFEKLKPIAEELSGWVDGKAPEITAAVKLISSATTIDTELLLLGAASVLGVEQERLEVQTSNTTGEALIFIREAPPLALEYEVKVAPDEFDRKAFARGVAFAAGVSPEQVSVFVVGTIAVDRRRRLAESGVNGLGTGDRGEGRRRPGLERGREAP